MQQINLLTVDLNLLVALDALLQERNVTRAGLRIGLTQSAMSHALRRLRDLFDDPLFVLSNRVLQPTPRATELELPLRELLTKVGMLLQPAAFDPAGYRGPLRLAGVDYQSYQLLPSLLARLRRAAPLSTIEVIVADGSDIVEQLVSGRADFALTPFTKGPNLYSVHLFHDDFVCVVRADHPVISEELTLKRFIQLDHCFLTFSGRGVGPVDTVLEKLGLERRIVLRLPHYLAAPLIVAESDLILTMPRLLARMLTQLAPLTVLELPFELEGYDLHLVWHARLEEDLPHRWIRGVIRQCVHALLHSVLS